MEELEEEHPCRQTSERREHASNSGTKSASFLLFITSSVVFICLLKHVKVFRQEKSTNRFPMTSSRLAGHL